MKMKAMDNKALLLHWVFLGYLPIHRVNEVNEYNYDNLNTFRLKVAMDNKIPLTHVDNK